MTLTLKVMLTKLFMSLARLTGLYSTLIWIRVLLTWLPSQRFPQNEDGPIVSIIKTLCDPFLNLFRKVKTRALNIDFSPLLALMTLNVLQSVFTILAQTGMITIGLVIALVVRGLWQYFFSYILFLLLIALGVRYICGRKPYSPKCRQFLNIIDPVLAKPVNFVAKIIYPKKAVSDQTYVLTALVFYAVIYFSIKNGLSYLVNYLAHV